MRRAIAIIACLLLLLGAVLNGQTDSGNRQSGKAESVTVSAAPEIENLAASWVEEYLSENPGRAVSLLPSGEAGQADIRLFSATPADIAGMTGEWKIVVARDILVPVMSNANPFHEAVLARGIDPQTFGTLLTADAPLTWGTMLQGNSTLPLTAGIPADEAAVSALARFAGIEASAVTVTRLSPAEDVTTVLKNNPGMIIFCRLALLTGEKGTSIPEGICIIPIDVNANGHSDYFEQFYGDYESFNRGVYIGKYPKELCSSIFCAANTRPEEGASADFIRWLLSGGQEFIAEAGFTALPGGEGMVRREMMAPETELIRAADHKEAGSGGWLWIAGIIAAVSILAYILYRIIRSRTPEVVINPQPVEVKSFGPATVTAPAGILYGKSHTWTFMEKNGTLTLGIDDFLQHVTGTISRITLRTPGEKIRRGERLASVIQRGKQLDIISPVSGTIISRNEKLTGDTTLLHSSPYAEGWIYGIEPENWMNESRLMTVAARYTEQIREEFGRVRDFLASVTGANDTRLAHVVLQDGGELKEGLLDEFGPEVWEEFQIRFMNQN
jgi:glycine cleavage system H lipoate-binding protein/ABC-type phosphate transport system substrate-binding protein